MAVNLPRRAGSDGRSVIAMAGSSADGRSTSREARHQLSKHKDSNEISRLHPIAMISIVIAAHNEAAGIGRCLDTLLADAKPDEFDVAVVANGCADDTATEAAARVGVRVIELTEPNKAKALNAGDQAANGFPRIYLD